MKNVSETAPSANFPQKKSPFLVCLVKQKLDRCKRYDMRAAQGDVCTRTTQNLAWKTHSVVDDLMQLTNMSRDYSVAVAVIEDALAFPPSYIVPIEVNSECAWRSWIFHFDACDDAAEFCNGIKLHVGKRV